jgi:hypothetical protein
MSNLVFVWNHYKDNYRRDNAKERLRDHIRNQSSLMNPQWDRNANRYQYLPEMNDIRKRLGIIINQCIKDQDYDTLMDCMSVQPFKRISLSEGIYDFFNDKFNVEVSECEDCGRIHHVDDSNTAYDGDRIVCNSCIDEYYYHERTGQYVHQDDENYSNDDYEDEDEDSIIRDYHSSKRILGKIPSQFDKRKSQVFMGLELEMEVTGDYDRVDKAQMILDNLQFYKADNGCQYTYCALENDGSLSNGFEMVTGYTGLDVHEKQLAYFKKPLRGLRSHDTSTCGLHIHIDKRNMTLNHATKLILFINDSGNQKLIRTIARRTSSRFAKIANKKADYQWLKSAKRSSDPLCSLNDDRYESLNFQNDRTVEFRLFKGTLKFESIMACLEFTYASWFFTKDHGYQDLTIEKFLEFIALPENKADTKYLRSYLKQHLFDVEVPKQNPRITENQLVTDEI